MLAADRRAAVLDAVARAGAFLLEDDWARDLSAGDDPPPPLAADDPDGHVVYVRSLTKSAAPGLRVAGIGARGAAGARLRAARIVDDFFVSGPLQEAALEVVSAPGWRRHRRRAAHRAARAPRRARGRPASATCPRSRPRRSRPAACTCGWRCPRAATMSRWRGAAAAEGVVVFPGRPWFPAEAPGPFLRLTYAAAPPDALDEGVRRLARALR